MEIKPDCFYHISVSAYPGQLKALFSVKITGLPELMSSTPSVSLSIVPDIPVAICVFIAFLYLSDMYSRNSLLIAVYL